MSNVYLEKIAANKLRQHMIANGQVADMRIPNAKLMPNSRLGTGSFSTGGNVTTTLPGRKGFLGIGGTGPSTVTSKSQAFRTTGDSLAGGIQGRTTFKGVTGAKADITSQRVARESADMASGKSFKAATPYVAPAAAKVEQGALAKGKGILGKAMSIAKRNPIATGAAALGAGVLAKKMLSSNNNQNQYQGQY